MADTALPAPPPPHKRAWSPNFSLMPARPRAAVCDVMLAARLFGPAPCWAACAVDSKAALQRQKGQKRKALGRDALASKQTNHKDTNRLAKTPLRARTRNKRRRLSPSGGSVPQSTFGPAASSNGADPGRFRGLAVTNHTHGGPIRPPAGLNPQDGHIKKCPNVQYLEESTGIQTPAAGEVADGTLDRCPGPSSFRLRLESSRSFCERTATDGAAAGCCKQGLGAAAHTTL